MFYDWTMIILLPAIVLTFIAQARVKNAFAKFSRVPSRCGMNGEQVARRILDANGLQNVPVGHVSGSLTDHYDPRKRDVSLSDDVYQSTSVAAMAIAAHECGHAIQHSTGYALLAFRNTIAAPVNLVSMASWPLLIIGILLIEMGNAQTGNMLFNIGVIAFGAVVLFHLVTLPVELDASRRALKQLQSAGIVAAEERSGARKVLSAAALTYVAALAMAVAQLLRILLIRGRN